MAESTFVETVADKAEGENGRSECIAGRLRATSEQLCEDFIVVLYTVLGLHVGLRIRRG